MVGVPRSRACTPCKTRRTTCDKNWPTCSSCLRKGIFCPGPSSLTKFVPYSPAPVVFSSENPGEQIDQTRAAPAVTSPDRWLSWHTSRTGRLVISRANRHNYKPGQQSSDLPSSPCAPISSFSARVSARLVYHLANPEVKTFAMPNSYLKFLPMRIAEHPGLCHSTALLCTISAGLDKDKIATGITTMPMYLHAIHSLSNTLRTDKAFTIETVACMVLLHRVEELADSGERNDLHIRGIVSLLSRIGPMEQDDEFGASIISDTYGLLLPYNIMTGWTNVIDDPLWKKTVVSCMVTRIGIQHLEAVVESTISWYHETCASLPALLQEFRECCGPRAALTERIHNICTEATKHSCGLFQLMMGMGGVIEKADADSPTGTVYTFPAPFVAQSLIHFLCFRLYIWRLYYEWARKNGLPNGNIIYTEVRDICMEVWKFTPLLDQIGFFSSALSQAILPRTALLLTLGIANSREKRYVLDIFENLDRSRRIVPRPRKLLEKDLLSQVEMTLDFIRG